MRTPRSASSNRYTGATIVMLAAVFVSLAPAPSERGPPESPLQVPPPPIRPPPPARPASPWRSPQVGGDLDVGGVRKIVTCLACLERMLGGPGLGLCGASRPRRRVSCPRQRLPIPRRAVPISSRLSRRCCINDPGCPWAYSANPAFRVLEWRYGAQLDWRLVLIGLTESAEQYVARGYTPLRSALGQARFRRFGMPFSPSPKARVSATARACRAVVAARLLDPGSEWRVFRALQLATFTSPILLEDEQDIAAVLDGVEGVDAKRSSRCSTTLL